MQILRLGETTAALIEIPFTTVSQANLQIRLNGTQLPNSSITVYSKRANVSAAVHCTQGAFVAVDDSNSVGVRGYQPASSEFVLGIQTFVFNGSNGGNVMEQREWPIMVIPDDMYAYVEGSVTKVQAMRVLLALLSGAPVNTSGSSVAYVDPTTGAKTRATITYDATGRLTVTFGDLS